MGASVSNIFTSSPAELQDSSLSDAVQPEVSHANPTSPAAKTHNSLAAALLHQIELIRPKSVYDGVEVTNDIRNDLLKLLIVGITGAGKSSILNVLSGHAADANIFPVSSAAESCTQKTKFANVNFNGDPSFPISLIDTIGFDDPRKNEDAAIIAELVCKLKSSCNHINLFVIAVNGQWDWKLSPGENGGIR